MKPFCLYSLLAFTFIAKGVVYGQSTNHAASFPTYNQIKAANAELIDYAPRQFNKMVSRQNVNVNLFDYPAGSVTYILNGKATANANYVKKILNRTENHIDSIVIGEAPATGKRILKITYTTEK